MVETYRLADWETRLHSLGHAVGLVVAAFLIGIMLSIMGLQVLLLTGLVEPWEQTPPLLATISSTALQFVGFGIVVYAYLRWQNERDLFRLAVPSLNDIGWMVGGFVGVYAVATGIGIVLQLLGVQTASNQAIELGQQNPRLFLYFIPITILFVAPAEELLFRGVVQGLFRRAYGLVPGVILASALFGVGHYLALTGGGKVTYLAIAAGLGLVLGTIYELTDNLAVPIVAHGLWNTLIFSVQYLAATGAVSL